MRYIPFILVISLLIGACKASQVSQTDIATTVYLVRHAEKAKDGTRNPNLTEAGKARAQAIANELKDKNISTIYSTDYKRTQQTAQPLAEALGLEIISYHPGNLEDLKNKILKEHIYGEGILVVGHSNTTPDLANLIIGHQQFESIDESDYNNLFKIEIQYSGSKKAANLKQDFYSKN